MKASAVSNVKGRGLIQAASLIENGKIKLLGFSWSRRAFGVDGLDNFLRQFRFFFERFFRRIATLADERAVELQISAAFIHRAARDAHVEDAAFLVNAVVVDDVELRLGERRRDFVF